VDKFNNDPHMFVFLISTKAGGVGLNIVSANKVYKPQDSSTNFSQEYSSIQTGIPPTISKPKTELFESDNVVTSKYTVSSPRAQSKKSSTPDRSTSNNKRISGTTRPTSDGISRAYRVLLTVNSLDWKTSFPSIPIDLS
jgi:hypothetical protein